MRVNTFFQTLRNQSGRLWQRLLQQIEGDYEFQSQNGPAKNHQVDPDFNQCSQPIKGAHGARPSRTRLKVVFAKEHQKQIMNIEMKTCPGFPNSAPSWIHPSQKPALDSPGKTGESFGPSGRSGWASASGFTLVETVVATFLAAIMLSAVYGGMGAGFSMVKVTRENLRATQILLQRMEAIRLSPYQALQNPASYPTNSTDYYCPGQTNGGAGVAYSVTYNCAPGPSSLPPSYRSNVVLVTVNASWTSGKVQRTRSMQTYVARYGIQPYVSSN